MGIEVNSSRKNNWPARAAFFAVLVSAPGVAKADEGGASYWTPGSYASMAATPVAPGWSITAYYYYANTEQNATGVFALDPVLGALPGNVVAFPGARQYNVSGQGYLQPTYTFADPVFGAQLGIQITAQAAFANATLSGMWSGFALTPGGTKPFTQYGLEESSISGLGDLAPEVTMKWTSGVNNFLAYVGTNVPIGQFNPSRLANIGFGHWVIDAGGGYTFYDQKTGWEFSGVLGFTYNFIDPSTQYQNGVDMHFDWAGSYAFNDKVSAGVAGYAYRQISCDGGPGDTVGCNEAQVFGVGPQLTYNFPVDKWQGSVNFRAYKDFWAQNRPEGWNGWLTLTISPPSPS
jgi:hypothetical protein